MTVRSVLGFSRQPWGEMIHSLQQWGERHEEDDEGVEGEDETIGPSKVEGTKRNSDIWVAVAEARGPSQHGHDSQYRNVKVTDQDGDGNGRSDDSMRAWAVVTVASERGLGNASVRQPMLIASEPTTRRTERHELRARGWSWANSMGPLRESWGEEVKRACLRALWSRQQRERQLRLSPKYISGACKKTE